MNELRTGSGTGNYLYATVVSPSSRWWNAPLFEAYSSSHYSAYAITMTEQGSTGKYVGNFPALVTDIGLFEIFYFVAQNGTSPTEGDPVAGIGSIDWDGTGVVPPSASVSGEYSASDWVDYVVRTFKRTDKTTEIYDATNEAIAEIRRTFATAREEKENSISQQIDTLGVYKMPLDSDYGLSVSDVFIRDRSQGRYLVPISKAMFDWMYSKWGSDASHRGRPKHYCLFGGHVLVGPVPDSTAYNYVFSFSKDDHVLVTGTTTAIPFTTTDYREILKHGVLMRIYSGVENDAQALKYGQFWLNGLKQIEKKEDRNRRSVTVTCYQDY